MSFEVPPVSVVFSSGAAVAAGGRDSLTAWWAAGAADPALALSLLPVSLPHAVRERAARRAVAAKVVVRMRLLRMVVLPV